MQTASPSTTPKTRPSTSPHPAQLTANGDDTPTRSLARKKLVLAGLLPARNAANSGSAAHNFSFGDTSPTSPAAGPSPHHLRNLSASISKSHSSNEVEAMRSSLVSVTQHAISAMRSGRLDLSPSTRVTQLPQTVASPAQRSASDNVDASTSVHWYPLRSAGTSVPLHCHCMFECFYRLLVKHSLYDSYSALCADFNLAVGRLAVSYLDEVTRMDLPPSTEVQVIEVVVGIRKKERGDRDKGKERRDRGDKSTGSASKKRDAAASSGKGEEEEKKAELGRSLSVFSPLHKSNSSPLRAPVATVPPPTTAATSPDSTQAPVSVTYPIAYPVGSSASSTAIVVSSAGTSSVPSTPPLASHSSHSTPHSPFSQPSTPSSHPLTPLTPSLLQYEQEVYAGSLADFIGPTSDYRGQTPSRSPNRDRGGSDERRRLEVDTAKRELQEMKLHSPASPASASSGVASPLFHQRQSSGESSAGGSRIKRPPRNKRTTSDQASRHPDGSSLASSPQSASPGQPASPRFHESLPASSRASVSEAVETAGREDSGISPSRLARSVSQPSHQSLMANTNAATPAATAAALPSLAGFPSQSSHSLRPPPRAGTSMSHHPPLAATHAPPAQPKTFGQSLYQFLMTKPTGASAAASGRGSASFTTGSSAAPPARGRGASGMPPNIRTHSSVGHVESTAAARRRAPASSRPP